MNQYSTPLTQEFIRIFSENPEEIAIIDTVSTSGKTKGDFLWEIYTLARGFQEHGMSPWDTIVVLTQDRITYALSIFATLLSWWRVAIIDPEMGKENIQEKLRMLKPKFYLIDHLILDGIHVPWVFWFLHPIFRNISLENLDEASTLFIHWRGISKRRNTVHINTFKEWNRVPNIISLDSNSDAVIVFTGWTTSEPKWVIHSHKSLFLTKEVIGSVLWDEKIFYADLPHFLLFWLLLWRRVIAWRDDIKPRKLRKLFNQYEVQSAFFSPSKIQLCIDKNITLPGCVAHLLIGSAPVFQSFLEKGIRHWVIMTHWEYRVCMEWRRFSPYLL